MVSQEKLTASSAVDKSTVEKVEAHAAKLKFYNSANEPPIEVYKNKKASMVVESPFYDESPSEALKRYNGIDSSMFPNNPSLPVFGDFTNVPNIAEASLIVEKAQEQFNGLDSTIRAKFDNDFKKFANYVNSPNFNVEELMTKEFKDNVYRQKQLNDAYAKQKKEREDWLLAHPNWQAEFEAQEQTNLFKKFDDYLKSKNLLQG